jgi:hypothetical protein
MSWHGETDGKRFSGMIEIGQSFLTLTMVFKLGLEAQKHWRRLQGFDALLDELLASFVSTLATLAASLLRNSSVLITASSVVWDEVVSQHLLLIHLSLKMDHHNEHIVC